MAASQLSEAGQAALDRRFMAAALRLSRRNAGRTSTNPSVGTLIVRDDGAGPMIVGTGVTAVGGRPHAETEALAEAGELARGATAYVTLEPCAHHGRTPPCANALVNAGIARVVGAASDPDPRVSGKGYAILRAAGIEVVEKVLAARSRRADGRLSDSIAQKAPGSDSEACAFQRRQDRQGRRRPGRDHRRYRAPRSLSDAGRGRRHPGRHRHGAGRRPGADRAPAGAGEPFAGAHRARPADPAAGERRNWSPASIACRSMSPPAWRPIRSAGQRSNAPACASSARKPMKAASPCRNCSRIWRRSAWQACWSRAAPR